MPPQMATFSLVHQGAPYYFYLVILSLVCVGIYISGFLSRRTCLNGFREGRNGSFLTLKIKDKYGKFWEEVGFQEMKDKYTVDSKIAGSGTKMCVCAEPDSFGSYSEEGGI